jgi:DNA-binding CsgD family transcriptional regulator/tetratricopeptide (TPR) repeat protein
MIRRMTALVGRERELAALDAVLGRAAIGEGAAMLVEAEAGLGKSTLLADLHARAHLAHVAHAEADEMEQGRPFGVIMRALGCTSRTPDERRRRVASLLHALPRSDTDELLGRLAGDRFVIQDAIVELVEELAAERTLVLSVDDAQWADPASLATLAVLVRHTRSLPVAVVVACRPWPRPPELDGLVERIRRQDGTVMVLGGLSERAIGLMVADIVGGEPGPRLLAAIDAAGGNPFYVRELLRHAADEGRLVPGEHTVELTGELTTEPFMDRLARRLDSMDAVVRNVLRVASLYGPSFDLRDLTSLIGASTVVLQQVTDDARRSGILRTTDDGRLAFTHDLFREAVAADLPATVREALHRDIATSLIARRAPVEQVVPHLLIGAMPGDDAAVDWLEAAAAETAAVDPIGAEQLLARASELAGPERRHHLVADRVRLLKWAGRLEDAASLANDALARQPDESIALRLRIELAEADLLRGRSSRALTPLLDAAEHADVSDETRAQLWSEVASSSLWTLDFALCERAAANAIALAGDTAPTAAALAHGLLARRHSFGGDLRTATEHAHLAADLARRFQPSARSVPMFYAGLGLLWTDPALALDVLQQGLRLAEKQGLSWSQPVYYQGLTSAAFDHGRWDDALAYYETGRDISDELAELGEPSIDAFVGLVHLWRGDVEAAERMLADVMLQMQQPNARQGSMLYISWLAAHLRHHRGDAASAASMLMESFELAVAFGAGNAAVAMAPDGVEWADPAVEHDRIERVTLAVEAMASVGAAPVQQAAALRCRAVLDDRPELAATAVEVLVGTGRDRDLLQTCLSAARALTAHGRGVEARPIVDRGLDLAERMGAAGVERHLHAVAREGGAVRGIRTARRRATFGWPSLTDTELRVVRLVRDGLTNGEIAVRLLISRRTVDTHLVNVYRKLGFSSRAALAAMATEQFRADQPDSPGPDRIVS